MGLKTGSQYKESLRDGRKLYIDGNLVVDVTQYAPLQGVIETIGVIYDDQHEPGLREILTYLSPTSGERVSRTYQQAGTAEDFRQLAGCYYARAQRTFGLMGRLTDFMSAYLMDQATGLRALGKIDAADRAQRILEHSRENDLQVTHALIDPQSDRSKPDAPAEALQVVDRRPDGIVVSGCRMLSTLAPVAHEVYVGPFAPRKPGEEKFALAFQIPMNAPGLSILARESFHRGQSHFDRPLSSRFDEGDAILMFDRVFVPDDCLIVDGDLDAYNMMMRAGAGYTQIQAVTRSAMKLRLLSGAATAVARANGRDKTARFQTAIGELVALVNVAEAIRLGTIQDALNKVEAFSRGETDVLGNGLSEPKVQGGPGFAALNFFFPSANTKAADVLRMAAGSGALAVTEADHANPDIGPLMDNWLIGPDIQARDRLNLMKLAWDLTGTEFASRAGLYERLYSGDPERNAMRWFAHPMAKECEGLVQKLLAA
jgi:4-hydroxyphenylacetate 3-monooxygenase